jgi:small-conductance mechanosensitive channel
MEIFNLQNWLNAWGAITLIGLPLLFLFATIVYNRREASRNGLVPPQIVKFLLTPFLFIYLILNKIIGIPEDQIMIMVLETVITIILISFIFNAINYLFFSEKNILTKKEIIPKLGRDVLHLFLIIIISACALSKIWGLDLGNLLTALGVSSLVVGLALQEPLGNLFNGISLLMANPFKKGDWVSIGDEVGKIVEINWRSVKLNTRSNEQVIIPNNMLGKEKIKNFSRPNKIHGELLKFRFSYDDPALKSKAVLLELAKKNKKVLSNPGPAALTLSYDDFYITYGLKVFVKDYGDIIDLKDGIMTSLLAAYKDNELTIPFPKQEIEVKMNNNL